MITRAVSFCARRPGPVIVVALLAAFAGQRAWRSLQRDALPELSDPRIAIVADWMGHSATEVAEAVTRPLTAALEGVPRSTAIRGSSMSGMAYVEVVFDSLPALLAGRAEIVRRLEAARARLPANLRVDVGPEASSTGWVFQYALVVPSVRDPMHFAADRTAPASHFGMRRFQDTVLRPALAAIPGVAEVASVGGEVEQLLVEARPDALRAKGVAFSDLVSGVRAALAVEPTDKIDNVDRTEQIRKSAGELAGVQIAPDMAAGWVDFAGFAPTVGGIVIARPDADVPAVVARVKQVLDRERSRLPEKVKLVVVYDRSELVERIERTALRALAEEMAVVVLVVVIFLLHGPSASLPLMTLPLVVLLTFGAMRLFDVPVTVMSLSGIGIALGMAVDADVVALEACHRRLERLGPGGPSEDRRAQVLSAGGSFAPAILASLMIAALSFLPVLAFTGETGRLLRPLAVTKTFVFAAAALVAVTVAPALRDRLFAGRGRIVPELANPLTRWLVSLYRPFVHFALRRPAFTLLTAVLAVLSCFPIAARIGAEFLPRIDEGDLLFMPTTFSGVSPGDAAMQLGLQDQAIAGERGVESVFGKVGRAETATDPAPFSMAETTIRVGPRASTTELTARLDRRIRFPGWTSAWTAPVRARMDMMSTGVRTPVGIRVVAAEPERLEAIGAAARAAVLRLPGTRSAVQEALGDETRLAFEPDPDALARHRVDAALARSTADLVLSGGQVGEITRGERRARVRIVPDAVPRRPEDVRRTDDLLRETTVRASAEGGGQPVPLALLGRIVRTSGPASLRAERGELVSYVHVDLAEGTDLRAYLERARPAVEGAVAGLGPGERIEWTGQYELWAAGYRRLLIIAPVVLLSMLGLLFLQFRSVTEALIVLASVPFALVGSFWTLFLLGYSLSAPVWVGLLSTVGLAMQMGVVMVVYIDDAFYRRLREGRLASREDIVSAHAEGTVLRLRPKIMTVATMAAGLAPLLWAGGAGAEIMKRVAAPMLGGLATSAFLTLEVLPVMYTIWRHRQLRRAQRTAAPLENIVGVPPPWAR